MTASTQTHVDGTTLIAVAEGDPDKQPSEEALAHIFSCPECGQNLREIRLGLHGLEQGAEDLSSLVVDPMDMNMMTALQSSASSEVEARARKFAITIAVIGVVLMVVLFLMPRFLSSWTQ